MMIFTFRCLGRSLACFLFLAAAIPVDVLSQAPVVRPTPSVREAGPPRAGVLRPVQPGVRTELLATPRSDAQLSALLASTGRRTYALYSFELGTRVDRARFRRWEGVLLLPRTADLGPVTDLRLEIPGEPALLDRWHRHADGTWSKVLLNRMGESVGVLSINEGWARAALDLDGDGLVDFLHMATLDGREDVLASVGEGTEFLERWLLGENVLCDPGASRDHPDRPSLLGVEGTLESCRDSGSRERGPLAGIGGEKAPSHSDPGDRLCEGRGAKRGMMPAGVGPRTDDGAVAGFVGWIVGKAFDAAVQGVATVRYANAAGVFIAITWEPAMVGERTETSDSVVEFGTSGGENPPGGDDEDEVEDEEPDASSAGRARWTPGPDDLTDAEEALDRYCAMRAQSARRYWMVSLEQAEKQAAGAAETDCDDPVTDPAAMDDRAAMPKCGPARESGSVTEQVMAMLGAYNDRRCGPYEQPGPDGQCRGGRNLSDGRARLWYGYGDLIGLVPCEGTACDPRQNP